MKSVRQDYLLHFRITEMMRSRSCSVMAVPDGRQRPRLNKSSAAFPPITLAAYFRSLLLAPCFALLKTRCICTAFHTRPLFCRSHKGALTENSPRLKSVKWPECCFQMRRSKKPSLASERSYRFWLWAEIGKMPGPMETRQEHARHHRNEEKLPKVALG
jgi:hypothetical protein